MRLHSLLECLIEMRFPACDFKHAGFPQFTVDDASDVNLKTQFAGNSNKKAQLTQGLRATAVRVYHHLGFLKFDSCTISWAVPENPTL